MKTCLVVDDSSVIRKIARRILEEMNFEIIEAEDDVAALDACKRAMPTAVLLDWNMPVMDGYELLAAIRAIDPVVPVLAFSAVTHTEQAGAWRNRGFTGHIAKPASLKALEQALQAIPAKTTANTAADHARAHDALPASGEPDNPPIPYTEIARYRSMLLEHLKDDGPELAAILLRHDPVALRHWAHRSAGAFLVIDAQVMVKLCRQVEALCSKASGWTPAIAAAGTALHEAVRTFRNETAGLDA